MLSGYDFRGEIAAILPKGAFLRRDRGEFLYITNAPMYPEPECGVSCAARLESMGYIVRTDGKMLRILPNAEKLLASEAMCENAPNAFCESVARFRGQYADEEGLKLFARGIKAYETGEGAAQYDRMVRECAAKALREGTGGGGLYAMAIILANVIISAKQNAVPKTSKMV